MWEELDYHLALRLYAWLPNAHFTNQAMTARLAYNVEAALGGKPGEFREWLPAFLRPTNDTTPSGSAGSVFSAAVIEDVNLAFDLGVLSQDALIALGPRRLRAAGAFRGDRDTTTTNQPEIGGRNG